MTQPIKLDATIDPAAAEEVARLRAALADAEARFRMAQKAVHLGTLNGHAPSVFGAVPAFEQAVHDLQAAEKALAELGVDAQNFGDPNEPA